MRPTTRRIVYVISFETLGIAVAALALRLMSGAPADASLGLSVIGAGVALGWSWAFNAGFEAWEARQPRRGRPALLRLMHSVLFEGGLVVILLPVMALWLQVTLWQALIWEGGLIAVFLVYTWAFTWAFDRIFGLPASSR